jgi:hypothetical protein
MSWNSDRTAPTGTLRFPRALEEKRLEEAAAMIKLGFTGMWSRCAFLSIAVFSFVSICYGCYLSLHCQSAFFISLLWQWLVDDDLGYKLIFVPRQLADLTQQHMRSDGEHGVVFASFLSCAWHDCVSLVPLPVSCSSSSVSSKVFL